MKKRILIIDDEPDFVELLQFRLQRDDCEFQVAHNGLEAMKLARSFSPDAILMDILLPDLDGLTLCTILRNEPETRDVPIFVVSGVNTQVTRLSALTAGATEFFGKPVDFAVLEATLFRALANGGVGRGEITAGIGD